MNKNKSGKYTVDMECKILQGKKKSHDFFEITKHISMKCYTKYRRWKNKVQEPIARTPFRLTEG